MHPRRHHLFPCLRREERQIEKEKKGESEIMREERKMEQKRDLSRRSGRRRPGWRQWSARQRRPGWVRWKRHEEQWPRWWCFYRQLGALVQQRKDCGGWPCEGGVATVVFTGASEHVVETQIGREEGRDEEHNLCKWNQLSLITLFPNPTQQDQAENPTNL